MIEINLSTSKSDSWVLDTESGSHLNYHKYYNYHIKIIYELISNIYGN